jgi:RNA polymerase sigma factor (sigma-70 family)
MTITNIHLWKAKVMQHLSDEQLVKEAQVGSREAFGCLADRYQSYAQRAAFRMVNSSEMARELAQEAILQAYLSLKHLREGVRFKNWLYGITLNVCRNYLREQKSSSSLSLESLVGGFRYSNSPDPAEAAEQTELQQLVLGAVNALSVREREAVLLFYFRQLSLQEISAELQVSVQVVKSRLYRARQQLKERLKVYTDYIKVPKRSCGMIKVTVTDVVLQKATQKLESLPLSGSDPTTDVLKERSEEPRHNAVVLLDEAGKRILPIWVGPYEGEAIAIGLRDFTTPRPLTFNFMASLLSTLGATLEEVRVEKLANDTFYAIAKLKTGDTIHELDARPSDALALAVRTGSPVYVAEEVMEQAGIAVPLGEGRPLQPGKGVASILKDLEVMMAKRFASTKLKEELDKSKQDLIDYVFGEE